MVYKGEIAHLPISKPTIGRNNYQGFLNKTEVLPKGWNGYNQRPIDCDIKVEHDVEITVRDGARLYVDVYRPVDEEKRVPAILSWSPFGKKYNGLTMLQMVPWHCGVIPSDLTGCEKFEGLDPGNIWVANGYAIVNVDARGAGNSDGVVPIMGTQEAEDGYDVIEKIAKMPWCNGNVALAGNSHLAIVQWFIAQLNPPSLKAIAPWEGCGDMYREQFVRGGIMNISNFGLIQKYIIQGNIGVEDFQEMHRRSPLINDYWADKRPDMKKISIPAYITGSDFGSIHTMGSLRGFMELNTPDKWIRWCGYQEWHDLWACPETNVELMRFFDRYLKDEKNDWESTPRIRWSVLQFGDAEAIQGIELPEFPLSNTEYRELFLASGSQLSPSSPSGASSVSYASASSDGKVTFTYTFEKKSRLLGLPKAHLFMSCPDHHDWAVTVELQKLDVDGTQMKHCTIPIPRRHVKSMKDLPEGFNSGLIIFNGPTGILRASHRHIDHSKSIHPQYPFHTHDRLELVEPGKVVELEIGIWAAGIDYEAGQSIRVQLSGGNPTWPELQASGLSAGEQEVNKGQHVVHFGGEFPSRVILPFVEA